MVKQSDVDEAADAAEDVVDDIADEAGEYYEAAESWVERQLADVRAAAREEPVKMMAIAAGIGVLFGAFFIR